MEHLGTNTEQGYVRLTKDKNIITALSTNKIQVGDFVTTSYHESHPVQSCVLEILEERPQVGKFIDESKRRTFYKLRY